MYTNTEFLETFCRFSIDFLETLLYNIDRKREGKPRETKEDRLEVNTMKRTVNEILAERNKGGIEMNKTDNLKEKLIAIFGDRRNWNKRIEIDGEAFRFVSETNEIRREVKQPSGTIFVQCAVMLFGNFVWVE